MLSRKNGTLEKIWSPWNFGIVMLSGKNKNFEKNLGYLEIRDCHVIWEKRTFDEIGGFWKLCIFMLSGKAWAFEKLGDAQKAGFSFYVGKTGHSKKSGVPGNSRFSCYPGETAEHFELGLLFGQNRSPRLGD